MMKANSQQGGSQNLNVQEQHEQEQRQKEEQDSLFSHACDSST